MLKILPIQQWHQHRGSDKEESSNSFTSISCNCCFLQVSSSVDPSWIRWIFGAALFSELVSIGDQLVLQVQLSQLPSRLQLFAPGLSKHHSNSAFVRGLYHEVNNVKSLFILKCINKQVVTIPIVVCHAFQPLYSGLAANMCLHMLHSHSKYIFSIFSIHLASLTWLGSFMRLCIRVLDHDSQLATNSLW